MWNALLLQPQIALFYQSLKTALTELWKYRDVLGEKFVSVHLSPTQISHGLPQQSGASNCLSNFDNLKSILPSTSQPSKWFCIRDFIYEHFSVTKYIWFTVTFQTCNAVLHPSRQYSSQTSLWKYQPSMVGIGDMVGIVMVWLYWIRIIVLCGFVYFCNV